MSNPNYEWNETNYSLTITIPLSYKIDKRQIDYLITDSYIKLNIPEMKILYFIDLFKEIDINTSKIILEENKILFFLQKKEEELWKNLSPKLTKNELKERRKLAEERYNEKIKLEREKANQQKKEFEKFVIDQSIKIDDEKRQNLRNKKEQEKKTAENDLYKFVAKIDNRKDLNTDEDDVIIKENKNEKKEKSNIEKIKEEYEKEQKLKLQEKKNDNKLIIENNNNTLNKIKNNEENNNNNIKEEKNPINFLSKEEEEEYKKRTIIESPMVKESNFQKTLKSLYENNIEENIQKGNSEIEKKLPEKVPLENVSIRPQETIKVNLTKKLIPTFAARESLAKEPPYPKNKKYVPEKNYLGQEIDERNPIWAKERGDNFYNNKDYKSAINAYNKSLELDPNFHKCLINRGTAFMCLGDFDNALLDFNKAMELIDNIDEKERSDAFYDRIYVRALNKKYAIYALKQDYDKAINIINNQLLIKSNALPFIIPEDIWKKIEKDKEMILFRMENDKLKIQGDKFLMEKKYDKAEEIYKKILSTESNNEKVLSNLSLIYLNQGKYDEVIDCCTKILNIFAKFKERIKIKNMNNLFEIKILLRRAKCYEIKNEMSKAEKDVYSIEKLEISNPQILKDIKLIKDKLKIHVVDTYKKQANEYQEKGFFSEALEYYEKAISVIKYSNIYNKIDLVKILLNRTACLIKFTQYDKTYLEFEKILAILSKQKAIADIQSNILLRNEVNQLEFLTYVKRAYVYTINNRIDDAIKDYTNALIIKPGDIKIKENIEKLKAIS